MVCLTRTDGRARPSHDGDYPRDGNLGTYAQPPGQAVRLTQAQVRRVQERRHRCRGHAIDFSVGDVTAEEHRRAGFPLADAVQKEGIGSVGSDSETSKRIRSMRKNEKVPGSDPRSFRWSRTAKIKVFRGMLMAIFVEKGSGRGRSESRSREALFPVTFAGRRGSAGSAPSLKSRRSLRSCRATDCHR